MKVLLDENIPVKARIDFGDLFEVKTVREMGWGGKKNGELLGMMVFQGFDFFITVDKNLKYQQNLKKFDIVIFLIDSINNKHDTIKPLIVKINEKIKRKSFEKFNIIKG